MLDDWIIILVSAAVFAAVSAVVNRTLGDRKRLKEAQKKMNDFQKEYKEAVQKKDDKKLKELEARDKEIMQLTKQMVILPFKAMIVILPLFFIAIWFMGGAFPTFAIKLPIALHMNEILSLNVLRESVYGVRGYFILSAAAVGIVLEAIISGYEKMKEKKQQPATPQPAMQPKP
ncbi:MAG: EMC3/TMCO1 family protein [Candidatus Micrarchaeota archaeon]